MLIITVEFMILRVVFFGTNALYRNDPFPELNVEVFQ